MNLKQLQYVQVLAENGSFSRAADVLGISQPSLSQYIKKIEQETGVLLFNRAGGDVRLTDAGKIYVEAGRRILDIEHQMQSRFSDLSNNESGTIVVGTSPYRSASMMPVIIKQFQNKYPKVQVVVEEMTSAQLLDGTEHGQFDLCLTVLPVDERIFTSVEILKEELILAVPKDFEPLKSSIQPDRKYPVVNISQLDNCRFVTITETQLMQKVFNDICMDNQITTVHPVTVKSLEAQIAMVRAGVGMAVVPSGIESFCSDNEVVFYSFNQTIPYRRVAAIWRKDMKLNVITQAFLDEIIRIYQ